MNKFSVKKGFTLLEALVAISILMVAVMAPITIAQKGLSSAIYSKNQMIASYLAQDALEFIKNRRDQVSINNNSDWQGLFIFGDSVKNTLCFSEQGCQIDTIKNSSQVLEDILGYSDSSYLKKNPDGFYQYDSGLDTYFTRQVNIKLINSDEALVTVTVKWGGLNNQVVIKTQMYNF